MASRVLILVAVAALAQVAQGESSSTTTTTTTQTVDDPTTTTTLGGTTTTTAMDDATTTTADSTGANTTAMDESTTTTAASATTCDASGALPTIGAVVSDNCPASLAVAATCDITCATGQSAVGGYTCLASGTLAGQPFCADSAALAAAGGTPQQVTKIYQELVLALTFPTATALTAEAAEPLLRELIAGVLVTMGAGFTPELKAEQLTKFIISKLPESRRLGAGRQLQATASYKVQHEVMAADDTQLAQLSGALATLADPTSLGATTLNGVISASASFSAAAVTSGTMPETFTDYVVQTSDGTVVVAETVAAAEVTTTAVGASTTGSAGSDTTGAPRAATPAALAICALLGSKLLGAM